MDRKRIFRELVEEVWHRGDLSHIREAFSPAFVGNTPRHRLQSLSDFRVHVTTARAAFPDIRFDVHQQVAEGDYVSTRYTVRGTHVGPFLGLPPTGRPVTVEAMTLHRLSGGRIAESWTQWDTLGLLDELGATIRLPGRVA